MIINLTLNNFQFGVEYGIATRRNRVHRVDTSFTGAGRINCQIGQIEAARVI